MKHFIILLVAIILSACASRNDVVHNGFLQKRKYKKGYNLSFRKKTSKAERKKAEEVVLQNEITKEKAVKLDTAITTTKPEVEQEKFYASVKENTEDYNIQNAEWKENANFFVKKAVEDSTNTGENNEKIEYEKRMRPATDVMRIITIVLMNIAAPLILATFGTLAFPILLPLLIFMLVDVFSKKYSPVEERNLLQEAFEDFPVGKSVLLVLLGLFLLLLFALFAYGFNFTFFASGVTLSEVLLLLLLGLAIISFAIVLFKIEVCVWSYIKAVIERIKKNRAYFSEQKGKEKKRKKEKKKELEERITEEQEKHLKRSKHFTWLTLLYPFFIVRAVINNIRVIKDYKENGNKKERNKAIWRLIFLPLFAVIGFYVFLYLLSLVGIISFE